MPNSYQMSLFSPLPVAFSHGQGAWLWDVNGKKYLDGLTGIAVCGLGHAHPAVTASISDQASKLIHTSNWYEIPLQEQLAERLCKLAGMTNAFFCNSGAEANEAAIKLARLYGHQRDILTPGIIVTEGSFHGRTLATLSASGNRKIQSGFDPLVQGFYRVPYNNLEAVQQVGDRNKDVVAVLVEPITGEGGVSIPDKGYIAGLRKICDERGWLLMLDEIQTGMCRTGKWFAFQHENVVPDVMSLAKGLGNGVPIGACLAHGKAATVFKPGNHGSTFSGNPLVCRVALSVIDVLEKENLKARAEQLGQKLLTRLKELLGDVPGVKEIRGRGLMLAIELDRPCQALMQRCLDNGVLINVTAESVVRILPPLILLDAEAEILAVTLNKTIRDFLEVK